MQLEVQRRVDAEKAMLQQQRELEEERQRLLKTERELTRRIEDEERLFQLNRQQRIDDEVRRRVERESRRFIDNGTLVDNGAGLEARSTTNTQRDLHDDDVDFTDLQVLPSMVAARVVQETQGLGEQTDEYQSSLFCQSLFKHSLITTIVMLFIILILT